ncbi:laminin subunit alpha-2 [Ditylenchus destructor]|uniref:Laminin subunit alpha-2 n=1 Tax=Ditylenchus destructor TaxID=166010 RepID=A0AAD4R2K5_9BILA|nr:laminin subunit alpha-2 [Ditylenchus destructor]
MADTETSSGFSDDQQPSCSTLNESQSTLGQESASGDCICHDHDFREAGCSHYRAELEQSKAHLKAHLSAIKKLIETNNDLRAKLEDQQKEQDSGEICECKALTNELNGVETELEASRDRSKELEEENADLRIRFRTAEEEVIQLRNQLEDVTMNRILIEDDDEVDATGAQSAQINGLRAQLRKCAADFRLERKHHEETAKQLENAQTELQKLQRDSRMAEPTTSSNYAQREREKLDSELKQCRIQLSVAEDQFQKASARVDELTQTLVQAIDVENELKAEKEQLRAELESRNASGDDNPRIQKLKEEVMSLKMSEAKLTTELKDAKQQILDREYANFNLAVQLENIKTELEASRKNLALAEIVKTDLTERAKVDQLEIQHFKKERSLAVAKEFELQEKVEKMEKNEKISRQKWKETEQVLQHTTEMLTKTTDSLTQANKETEKLKGKISEIKTDAKREQRERARVNKATVDELQDKNKKLTQELEAAKGSGEQVENLQKQITDLRKKHEQSEKTVLDLENDLKLSRKLEYQMGNQLEKCSAELLEIRRLLKESEQSLKDERILRYNADRNKLTRSEVETQDAIAGRNNELYLENKDLKERLQKSAQNFKKFEKKISEMETELKKMGQDKAKVEAGIRALSQTESENVAKIRAEYEEKVRKLSEANSKLAAAKIKEEVDEQEVEKAQEKAEAERLERDKLKESLQKFGDDVKTLQATLTNYEAEALSLKDLLKKSEECNKVQQATISNGKAEVEKLKEEFRKKMSEVEILKQTQEESESRIRELSEVKSEAEKESAKVRAVFENKISDLSEQNAKLAAKIKENEMTYLAKIEEIEEKLESAEKEYTENAKLVDELETELEEAREKEHEWEEETKKKMLEAAMKASRKALEECFSKESSSEDRKRPSDNSRTDHAEARKRRCKSIHPYSTPVSNHNRAAKTDEKPEVSAQELTRRRPSLDWQVVTVKPNTGTAQDSTQNSVPETKEASPSRDARLTPDSTSNHELAFANDNKLISKQTNFPTLPDENK